MENVSCGESNGESVLAFSERVLGAIEGNQPIILAPREVVSIDTTILVKTNSAKLIISGPEEDDPLRRPRIIGTAHSIFQIGGRNTSLVLNNLELIHNCARDDHKDVGANVFGLNLASIELNNCRLISTHGFCLWAVQRSRIVARNCIMESSRRSGCVAFGKSRLELTDSRIENCGIHAVCSRGNTKISMQGCQLLNNEKRAVYAYHSVDLLMENCTVAGTRSSQQAAIDIFSSTPKQKNAGSTATDSSVFEDSYDESFTTKKKPHMYNDGQGYTRHIVSDLKLCLLNCTVASNRGIGVRIRDDETCKVNYRIEDCTVENNAVDDIVFGSTDSVTEENEDRNDEDRNPLVFKEKESIADNSADSAILWEYEVDDSSDDKLAAGPSVWVPYDVRTSEYLEQKFSVAQTRGPIVDSEDSISKVLLPPPRDCYEIDFETMMQTNMQTFYCRSIRRRLVT
jgi:hypothetical protein